jgi:hypothetical protein
MFLTMTAGVTKWRLLACCTRASPVGDRKEECRSCKASPVTQKCNGQAAASHRLYPSHLVPFLVDPSVGFWYDGSLDRDGPLRTG